MSWKNISYRLAADAGLYMHNSRLADPLDPIVKDIKKITSKRKKTDADHQEIARLEFMGGLYMTEGGPILPSKWVDGVILSAAKKLREGPLVKAGFYCLSDARLEYDGPRTADEMWAKGANHLWRRDVSRLNRVSIMRTRPYFQDWSAQIECCYEDTLVNESQVDEWILIAGTQLGIGDWRPRYGRFRAEKA